MRKIGKALAMTALAAGVSVQAALITNSFTAAEGFVSGGLNGQNGWNAQAGWSVDPTAGGKITATASTGMNAIHTDAVTLSAGESLTFRTELKLLGTPSTPTANKDVMHIGLRTDTDASITPTGFHNTLLRFTSTGNLMLTARNGGTPTSSLGTIAAHGSANLAVEYTLNIGASAAESTFVWKLINMDTSAVSPERSEALDGTIYTALTSGSGVFPYLRAAGASFSDTGLTGIDVYSTTVIPEPATVGLFMISAVGLMAARRMHR